MHIISFPFYFLLYLILAIACAKWFASRLRRQATEATPARVTIKSTKTVLPIVQITSITTRPRDLKHVRFFWLMAEKKCSGPQKEIRRYAASLTSPYS